MDGDMSNQWILPDSWAGDYADAELRCAHCGTHWDNLHDSQRVKGVEPVFAARYVGVAIRESTPSTLVYSAEYQKHGDLVESALETLLMITYVCRPGSEVFDKRCLDDQPTNDYPWRP